MNPIKAIFFDIGDTLVFDDPPLMARLVLAANKTGATLDQARLPTAFQAGEAYAVARYVEGIPWDSPASLRGAITCVWRALDRPPPNDMTWPLLAQALAAVPFTRTVHPDALALLRELRARGFTLGAVSDWEATLPALLTDLGIAPLLDALAVSEIVGATKPSPRLFREAMRQASAAPETSLHVGDWYELDVQGARAAGMSVLLFDHAGRCPDADCPRVQTFDALSETLLALPRPA